MTTINLASITVEDGRGLVRNHQEDRRIEV
jgi:hypothetical protein